MTRADHNLSIRTHADVSGQPERNTRGGAALLSLPVVGVVDDDPSFRAAITRLLRAAGYQVETFSSAEAFVEGCAGTTFGCLLLDVSMPGQTGLQLQETLMRAGEDLPVVFVSGHGDVRQGVRAMKGGAVDFLTKPVGRQDLVDAIERALTRGTRLRAEREERERFEARLSRLTRRERQVFEMVVTGRMNKQIADDLGTTLYTVKVHRGRVMAKMEADSLTALVRMAERLRHPASPSS